MNVGQQQTEQALETEDRVLPPGADVNAKTDADYRTALGLLLVAVTLILYLQVFYFPFLVFDDTPQIVARESIHHWKAIPSYFTQDLWESGSSGSRYYRPFFQLWLLINYELFGLHSVAWHAALLSLYASSVFLLWRWLLALGITQSTAFFTSLLFAVHPAHVESVAWLSGSVDSLLGVFVFAGLLAYVKWSKSGRWRWLALSGILALAAMWTKEAGLALPILMLLHTFFIAPQTEETKSRRFLTCLGAVGPVVIYGLFRASAMHTVSQHSWPAVFKTAPMLSCFYLLQALWPVRLAGWYDLDVVYGWPLTTFWIPCFFGGVSVVVILLGLRQRRLAAYFGAFWWVTLSTSLVGVRVFLDHDLAHDRYNFLAVAALCFLVVSTLKWLPASAIDVPRLGLPVIALLLALATLRQVNTWGSNEALYRRALEISPRSARPRSLLVGELMKKGQLHEALQLARSSVDLDPRAWENSFVLGVVLRQTGQVDASEEEMRRCIKLYPKGSVCYLMLAGELQNTDPDQALAVLKSAPADVERPDMIDDARAAIQRSRSQTNR